MTYKAHFLFCDNEHGTGDVCFPDLDSLDSFDTKQRIINATTARQLRADAKKAGWGHVNGGDYCPDCMENGI